MPTIGGGMAGGVLRKAKALLRDIGHVAHN